MPLWDAVAGLPVRVEGHALERRELQTSSGSTRVTTTVVLAGAGETGQGEDASYAADDHEDPWLEDGCREALAGAEDRLSFDAPVHSPADLDALPLEPRWLTVKPSRFGTVREPSRAASRTHSA